MAKIYMSYSKHDIELANKLRNALASSGHDVFMDRADLVAGSEWRKVLSNTLRDADGMIVLVTEKSVDSQYVFSEIGAARTYLDADNGKFLIPVIIGDIQIPIVLQDILCLRRPKDVAVEALATDLHHTITLNEVRLVAEQDKAAKKIEKIEVNASKYVDVAMIELKKRERVNNILGTVWYVSGFISLVGGILFSLITMRDLVDPVLPASIEWSIVIILTLKTIVIIGLLVACSKYCFTLGKSYINEALKNADRAHAISFGKFYLDAYGSTSGWQELKEVFQYWNINNESSFTRMDTQQYDPQFIDTISKLYKVMKDEAK